MALSGLGVQNWLIYCAGYTASATNMSLISILGPVFLILLSGKPVRALQVLGICSAVFGVLLIILRGSFANLASFRFVSGDFYMLGSAVLFAVYALIQRRTPNDIEPTALLTAAVFVSALIYFIPALTDWLAAPVRHLPKIVIGILLILGIVNSALAYLSWDIVIKKIGTIKAGTMYYTLPIFSITAAYFLLHERIYAAQLIGAVLILLGVLCVIFGTPKEKSA
jgi:drug/metabolite transporter (DMT)-like permease